ncbi:MAG: helix-turn-helix domain-containing protein [archaeon]
MNDIEKEKMKKFLKQFGRKIKYYRDERGLTQKQLANKSACTKGYLSMVEAGTNPPNVFIFYTLVKALNVSADVLLGTENMKEISSQEDPIFNNIDFEPYIEIAKKAYLNDIPTKVLLNTIKIMQED